MDIEFYSHSIHYDPVIMLFKAWSALTRLDNVIEHTYDFQHNGAGWIPNLRINHKVVPKEHILPFLKRILDLNIDLRLEERQRAELIEESCLSMLHPATMYLSWFDKNTDK
jgi:hypothetical protein